MKWGTVMSRYLFGLLLAGAAAPALAAGGPFDHQHRDDRSSHQESRAERPSRGNSEQARPQSNRSERAERPQSNGQRPQFAGRPEFAGRPQFAGRPEFSGQRPRADGARPQFAARPDTQSPRPQWNGDVQRARPVMRENPYTQQSDSVRRVREQQVRPRTDQQHWLRTDSNGYIGTRDQRVSRYGTREGRPQAFTYSGHRDSRIHWNNNWRNDHRYDWRDRRRHNRSLFHLSLYVDPFGWGYQPYSIGYDLYPGYYQQNYWIDPGMYGLPYPPPGTQWVRYYNDALLIDMYSGQIVDAIQNFFW